MLYQIFDVTLQVRKRWSCSSWIIFFGEQLTLRWFSAEIKSTYDVQSLPDEILVEILSRIPAKKVLEHRRVCKRWNTLTSTPNFAKKHLKNSSPSILIAYTKKYHNREEERVFLCNEWGETTTTTTTTTTTSKMNVTRLHQKSICPVPLRNNNQINAISYSEYPGLLILTPLHPLVYNLKKSEISSYVLYNPVTRQKLILNTYLGFICVCFYNSFTEEHEVMWVRRTVNSVKYRILNLGSQIDQQLSWRPLKGCNYFPVGIRSVLLNNKAVHWMTSESNNETLQPWCNDSILIFDIKTEMFSTMPHPGHTCTEGWNRHRCMHLLEFNKGVESECLLCLCDCSMQDQIDMWVLEDYEKRSWVIRHRIVLDISICRSPLDGTVVAVLPFGLLNGEMLINIDALGVFSYNLCKGTLRRIIEVADKDIGFDIRSNKITHVGLFRNSLASLTNFDGLHCNMEHC